MRALSKGFRAAYDSLGYVVFVTFLSFVTSLGLCGAAVAVLRATKAGMWGILYFAPALAVAWLAAVGVFYYANRSVYHQYPSPADTWVGIRTLLVPALKLLIVDLVVTTILCGDAVFFLRAKGSSLFPVLGVACGYGLFVWLMMLIYHLPLLVAQLGMESGPRPLVIVRKSFLLLADNPGFTVGLFLAIIALAVACVVPAFVGMALVYLGGAAFVLTHALRELFIRYGIVEEEPEVVQDGGWPR